MTLRKYFAVAATTLALTGGALLVGPASPAFAAYNCTFDQDARNNAYAGYYAGNTTQPSSTGLSQAGIEAQCLLQYRGFSPGTIDGVFGTNSQNAAKASSARRTHGTAPD